MTGPRGAFAAACLVAACLAAGPGAAAQVVATGRSKAVLLRPQSLVNTAPLSFGTIAPGDGGTVTVNPDGRVSYGGSVTGLGGDISAASFVVSVGRGRNVKIGTPKNPIILTQLDGTATMRITTFTNLGKKVRIEQGADVFEFTVGGTLTLAGNQAEGSYQGELDVTFDNN